MIQPVRGARSWLVTVFGVAALALSRMRLVRPILLPALDWYERRLKSSGRWSFAWAQRLGMLRENAQDWASAERLYLEALAATPDSPNMLLHLGMLCEAQGRKDDAARNYTSALKLGVDLSEALKGALGEKVRRLRTSG